MRVRHPKCGSVAETNSWRIGRLHPTAPVDLEARKCPNPARHAPPRPTTCQPRLRLPSGGARLDRGGAGHRSEGLGGGRSGGPGRGRRTCGSTAQPPDHPGELLILLNKPAGLVCSARFAEGPSVYGLLPERWRRRNPPVTSVGRLDKDTTGLLLLTDAERRSCTGSPPPSTRCPRSTVPCWTGTSPRRAKTVFSRRTAPAAWTRKSRAPLPTLRWIGSREAEVVLTEGRYHQVKRMFALPGLFGPGARYGLALATSSSETLR